MLIMRLEIDNVMMFFSKKKEGLTQTNATSNFLIVVGKTPFGTSSKS